MLCLKKPERRTWTQSVPPAVAGGYVVDKLAILMLRQEPSPVYEVLKQNEIEVVVISEVLQTIRRRGGSPLRRADAISG